MSFEQLIKENEELKEEIKYLKSFIIEQIENLKERVIVLENESNEEEEEEEDDDEVDEEAESEEESKYIPLKGFETDSL